MARKVFFSLFAILVLNVSVEAQFQDVKFVQGDTLTLIESKKNYFDVDLKAAPFSLIFKGNELHVCAGLDESLFEFTKPDTDINADASSYFFIFKYLAGSQESDFLSIEKDTGVALNETHGAFPDGRGYSIYNVRRFMIDGDLVPISEFKRVFFAFWLDKNKDQFIDKMELLWVRANFKKK